MEDHRLPKIVLHGELSTGHRDKGKYTTTLWKRSFATCNMDHRQWTTETTNRMNWRCTVYKDTASLEITRRVNMEDKRRRRKDRDTSDINTAQTVTCSRYGKTFLSRITFISHQRSRAMNEWWCLFKLTWASTIVSNMLITYLSSLHFECVHNILKRNLKTFTHGINANIRFLNI